MLRLIVAVIVIAVILFFAKKGIDWKHFWYPFAPKPKMDKTRIACVGDSITFGAGVPLYRQHKDSYPARLQKLLGDDFQVMNFGLCGRTAVTVSDFPYYREKMYPLTFQAKAKYYLCLLGTNDSKQQNWNEENYKTDLMQFLKKYVEVTDREHVIVMKPPKAFRLKDQSEVMYDVRDEVIQTECRVIDVVAAQLGIHVLDLYHFTESHAKWFTDGIHPDAEGNREIARFVYEETGGILHV